MDTRSDRAARYVVRREEKTVGVHRNQRSLFRETIGYAKGARPGKIPAAVRVEPAHGEQ